MLAALLPDFSGGALEQASPEEHSPALQRAVLGMVIVNAFSTPLMLSAANVALPAMARELDLSAVVLSWVPMAYLMASAMFVLVFGRFADMYGRKRIFLIGTGAVILSSLLAAMSTGAYTLLSARFLQGVSAAMLYATQMALVSTVFPPSRRGRAIGLVISAIYTGLAAGPLIGGYVIDLLGWRASFLLQIPLALMVLLFGLFAVRREWKTQVQTPLDMPGVLSYNAGILLFCLGVSQLPGTLGGVLLLAGVAMIVYFLRHSKRASNPIWDVRLFFNNRIFTLSCLAALIMYSATFANVVLMSLYLQYLKGLSATGAGLVMMIQPVTMAVFSPLMGRLSDKVEPRILASLGMTVTTAGLFMLALLTAESPFAVVYSALVMTGLGFSLFSSPNVNAIMGAVEPRHYGSASGTVAIMRLIGQLNSMVLVTLALTLVVGNTQIEVENYARLESAIGLSFSIAAALCVPGIILSLKRGRMHSAAGDS